MAHRVLKSVKSCQGCGYEMIARASPMLALFAALVVPGQVWAADDQVAIKPALTYAEHDGIKLLGDLYLPKSRAKAPALLAFHGGAWRAGDRSFYQYWGPFLARKGYALFAADYRLGKAGVFPAAVYDCKAAIQFLRAKAPRFDLDPDRIALMGDSAGAHLAALLALAGDRFAARYAGDANSSVPIGAKAVVGFYGIYDLLAQWNHDRMAEQEQEGLAQRNGDRIRRPADSITEEFLGAAPKQNPRLYSEASPISYAAAERNRVRFLLITGSRDELVDPEAQSGAFATALRRAGFFVQRTMIAAAGHFWVSDPFENAPQSYGAVAARALLRFAKNSL